MKKKQLIEGRDVRVMSGNQVAGIATLQKLIPENPDTDTEEQATVMYIRSKEVVTLPTYRLQPV